MKQHKRQIHHPRHRPRDPVLTTATTQQVNTVDRDISKAKHELESKAESARIDALKKIEEVDRKTTEAAAKSKGWFSSWFGGK